MYIESADKLSAILEKYAYIKGADRGLIQAMNVFLSQRKGKIEGFEFNWNKFSLGYFQNGANYATLHYDNRPITQKNINCAFKMVLESYIVPILQEISSKKINLTKVNRLDKTAIDAINSFVAGEKGNINQTFYQKKLIFLFNKRKYPKHTFLGYRRPKTVIYDMFVEGKLVLDYVMNLVEEYKENPQDFDPPLSFPIDIITPSDLN